MDIKAHWERIYTSKATDEVSWFELTPTTSIRLIEAANVGPSTSVIDVGGGDSRLVDYLVAKGVGRVVVLDISGVALARAKARIGPQQDVVNWIEADVIGDWSIEPVDIWHDRAVFHFLTDVHDRARYISKLRRFLKPGGSLIIATFALDGPPACSGLPVRRYSPETLLEELGSDLVLEETVREQHATPAGDQQSFVYCRFRRC